MTNIIWWQPGIIECKRMDIRQRLNRMKHEINRATNDDRCRLLPGCHVSAPGVHARATKWRGGGCCSPRRLVATSLTAMWYLEWVSVNELQGRGQEFLLMQEMWCLSCSLNKWWWWTMTKVIICCLVSTSPTATWQLGVAWLWVSSSGHCGCYQPLNLISGKIGKGGWLSWV